MAKLASRFRRLDDILADLPLDDPMLLSELDGYLTAVAVCPEPIDPDSWMPPIWEGTDGGLPPFDEPADVRLLWDMVLARHREILRDLGRGRLQPIFDVDERYGDVLWEIWIGGFATAMGLRPDSWGASGDEGRDVALSALRTLTDVARDAASLDSAEINALCDTAPAAIVAHVQQLYVGRGGRSDPPASTDRAAKVGRNDPCLCGSGRKYKQCCGRNG